MTVLSIFAEQIVQHMKRFKRRCGCIFKCKCGSMPFSTEEPNISAMSDACCDRKEFAHRKVKEALRIDVTS